MQLCLYGICQRTIQTGSIRPQEWENIGDNDNVSEYLVTEEMVEMCKKKLACESQG